LTKKKSVIDKERMDRVMTKEKAKEEKKEFVTYFHTKKNFVPKFMIV